MVIYLKVKSSKIDMVSIKQGWRSIEIREAKEDKRDLENVIKTHVSKGKVDWGKLRKEGDSENFNLILDYLKNIMNLWIISFFTGLVAIGALYYAFLLKKSRIQIPALIAFSLLLLGESMDLFANIALNNFLLFFAEILEMFITVGFFSLVYYLNIQRREYKKKKKKRKKRKKK